MFYLQRQVTFGEFMQSAILISLHITILVLATTVISILNGSKCNVFTEHSKVFLILNELARFCQHDNTVTKALIE